MAISRKDIMRLGVSYGTGAINFGNNSTAYEKALREFPEDEKFQAFLDALAKAESEVEIKAEEETEVAEKAEAAEEAASSETLEPEHVNPLADVIVAAREFREVCSRLALSDMFVKMGNIINQMNDECLPTLADLAELKANRDALIDYLNHH